MYFVISAGGTAGHINPAIAVALELREQGHEIVFIGSVDRLESKLATDLGFEFYGLNVSGFNKSKPMTLATSSAKIAKATGIVKEIFVKRRPDAVITFGAYVSVAVGRAAHSLKIPLLIHEQNSLIGMANSYLARFADCVCLTYEIGNNKIKCKNPPIIMGLPVRPQVENGDAQIVKKELHIPDDACVLLVFGGSLGAHHINEIFCELKKEILAIDNVYVIQSTGTQDYKYTKDELNLTQDEQKRWFLYEYIDNMGDMLAVADLVVSRAGASTLAEIVSTCKPTILIPYPHARKDHQTLNAKSCVDAGASFMFQDTELHDPKFKDCLFDLLNNKEKREKMGQSCKNLWGGDARRQFAKLIVDTAKAQNSCTN
ncbi:MAG: undecaprenyldiphospho-muramoylpentapeptide beta-N-acetylglucosaminyltransferase [Coriobacteriales bacterium]|nr:undecaprenyldiphospho-muramoylpentapeptide beta-N-acetylglucosaminyltransferase [Coriobacteriales bacterium]